MDDKTYPGSAENTKSIKDILNDENQCYSYSNSSLYEPSFRDVFPNYSEHIFRNCCLKVIYGEMNSYNLWDEHNTQYNIDYWKAYSDSQSDAILNSIKYNYNNYYNDLHYNINNWSKMFENCARKSNNIICKIVEWLFS